MRSFIEWRDDWLLGISRMDDEHKQMVDLINQLAGCCNCRYQEPDELHARPPFSAALALLDELGEQTRRHFRHEEQLMRDMSYPDYENHRCEHAMLLAEYAQWLRDIRRQGAGCLEESSLRNLKGWVIGHIVLTDKKLGDYYQDRVVGLAPSQPDAFSRRYLEISLAE